MTVTASKITIIFLFIIFIFAEEQPKRLPTPSAAEPEAPHVRDSAKEAEDKMRKLAAGGLPQSAKIRPWDFGKEGVPIPKKPGNMFMPYSINGKIALH